MSTTSSSTTSSPFSPITLTGVSTYSSDLQRILNRAVAIAEIPIQALQNRDTTVLEKESALGQLQSASQGLAGSLTSLGALSEAKALSASTSDSTIVTATNTGATTPARYTIDSITSVAAAASEHSRTSYADATTAAVSSSGKMQLVVGAKTYPITLTSNNLSSLQTQINSLGAGVTASILTTSGGDYLSLSANSTGATKLQLIDDPTGAAKQWLTSANQGSDAVFSLNGIPVDEPGNTINDVVPGMTFNLLDTTTSPVTLTLSSDASQLTSALQSFVTNYNAVRSALNAQEGPAAGALSGDSTVIQLEGAMRRLAAYTGESGSIRNLSDLGITFATDGTASFDSSNAANFSGSQLSAAFDFLGSATSGLVGGSQSFHQFGDPLGGLIHTQAQGLAKTDQSLQAQINVLTSQLTVMQTNLASQLQSADSLIAMLQSQQTALTASLQGLNVVLYGKNQTAV